MSHHSRCRGRELEIAVAIDPKRNIRLSAVPPTPPSDMASPLRAEFLYWRVGPQKDVQRLKQDGSNAEEFAGPYIRFVPFQEFPPARGWPSMVSRSHVLADGPCRNPNPNLAFAEMIARTSHHASPVDATSAPSRGLTMRSDLRRPANHRLVQI
jgi:hypothetical protein